MLTTQLAVSWILIMISRVVALLGILLLLIKVALLINPSASSWILIVWVVLVKIGMTGMIVAFLTNPSIGSLVLVDWVVVPLVASGASSVITVAQSRWRRYRSSRLEIRAPVILNYVIIMYSSNSSK